MNDPSTKAIELAAKLFNLGAKHDDHKKYSDYHAILQEVNQLPEQQQVEFLLQVANLIDAYTYQNPPKK